MYICFSSSDTLAANSFPVSGGAITGSYEVFWESERGGGWEDLSETKIDSYAEMALRAGYESDNSWYVEAYVENLTDEVPWDGENNNGACVGGEVRLGCHAPPHCPLKRNALPSYDIEQGRWSLSGGKCAHKKDIGSPMDAKGLITIIALVAIIFLQKKD